MAAMLRDSANRSWSAGRSGVPAVGDPAFWDVSAGGDDGVGQDDEGLERQAPSYQSQGSTHAPLA